jgi:hypothetical protein
MSRQKAASYAHSRDGGEVRVDHPRRQIDSIAIPENLCPEVARSGAAPYEHISIQQLSALRAAEDSEREVLVALGRKASRPRR